jgi:translin
MNLKKIFSEIIKKLDGIDKGREEILTLSREMIRNCSIAIKSIHRNEINIYEEKIREIEDNHETLLKLVDKDPIKFSKYLKTPEQEYMEAICLFLIINDKELPNPTDYKVDEINYLLGLADVIGELRRYILDKIRKNDVEDLEKFLDTMEEIYTHLFSLDYPKGITQDLRHKTDVARSIIEKTRGDISLSATVNRLNNKLKKDLTD